MQYRIIVEDWETLKKRGVYQVETDTQNNIVNFQILFQDTHMEIPHAQNIAELILALQSEGEIYTIQY